MQDSFALSESVWKTSAWDIFFFFSLSNALHVTCDKKDFTVTSWSIVPTPSRIFYRTSQFVQEMSCTSENYKNSTRADQPVTRCEHRCSNLRCKRLSQLLLSIPTYSRPRCTRESWVSGVRSPSEQWSPRRLQRRCLNKMFPLGWKFLAAQLLKAGRLPCTYRLPTFGL